MFLCLFHIYLHISAGLENHRKTLAEIQESLRPYQTSGGSRTSDADAPLRKKIQMVMRLGVSDEVRYLAFFVVVHSRFPFSLTKALELSSSCCSLVELSLKS